MPVINLELFINAPIKRVFDLSRSIDLHVESTKSTGEIAVDGVKTGLIGLDQFVTWEARHFFIKQRLTSSINKFDSPLYFQDVMVHGAFSYFIHDHRFIETNDGTLMMDRFEFASPFGFIGKIIDYLVIKKYLTTLLTARNETIKKIAEGFDWPSYLN